MKKEQMDEWLELALEGEANEEQLAELREALRENPEWLVEARAQADMHAALGVAMEDEVSRERWVGKALESVRNEEREEFVDGVRQRVERRRMFGRIAAVAAVLMLSVGSYLLMRPGAELETMVARLSRIEGVSWSSDAMVAGDAVERGERLRIASGLLEMDLAGRGRLIVEGPADLEFVSADHAVLTRGRVVMRATEKGHGYRIETPKGSVIDIGTEFGVVVGDDGVVETHVIEGEVEAVGLGGERVLLGRSKGLRFGPVGGERISADLGEFYTEMPPVSEGELRSAHWSFDEGSGARAYGDGALVRELGEQADVVLGAFGKGGYPERIAGARGGALSFDGVGSYAESGYRGIGGGKARTVCFWVKVPKDFSPREGFAIVSWGRLHQFGAAWQVSVNPVPQDGELGRLRVGLHGGQVLGATDLRDGRWHHVAVVLYGGSQPDVGTHVMLYLDGELEQISRRALQEVRTEVEGASHGLWLGRNVDPSSTEPGSPYGGFFRGGVDELHIFEGVLSRRGVLEVMGK